MSDKARGVRLTACTVKQAVGCDDTCTCTCPCLPPLLHERQLHSSPVSSLPALQASPFCLLPQRLLQLSEAVTADPLSADALCT